MSNGGFGNDLGPSAPATGGGGWVSTLMSKPENRAALMQASIALLQPINPGQTPLGAFGQAVGQGAAARSRNLASRQAEQTQAQELSLKNRQVTADETRADASLMAATGKDKSGRPISAGQAATLADRQHARWLAYAQKAESDSQYTDNPIDLANPDARNALWEKFQAADVMGQPAQPSLGDAIGQPSAGAPAPIGALGPSDQPDGTTATGPNGVKIKSQGGFWIKV